MNCANGHRIHRTSACPQNFNPVHRYNTQICVQIRAGSTVHSNVDNRCTHRHRKLCQLLTRSSYKSRWKDSVARQSCRLLTRAICGSIRYRPVTVIYTTGWVVNRVRNHNSKETKEWRKLETQGGIAQNMYGHTSEATPSCNCD
jgi:hypothetical protein